ncbi:MAG: hypothetical protein LW823_09140 [Rickettsiales bacterium]|jgi:hypothetical protein|nr:hypothetical protein [Rickettsiales bacterium]
MKMFVYSLLIGSSLFAFQAAAKDSTIVADADKAALSEAMRANSPASVVRPAGADCAMQEQVSIGVNFNAKASGFMDARKQFDEMSNKVEQFAKQQNIKLSLQNMNYSVNVQQETGGPSFQIYGNMNYQMDNADSAFKFAEFLTQQKLQVSLNSNAYRAGMCNQ